MLFRKYVLLLVASMIAALFLGSCTPAAKLEPTTTHFVTPGITTASSTPLLTKTLTPTPEPTETQQPTATLVEATATVTPEATKAIEIMSYEEIAKNAQEFLGKEGIYTDKSLETILFKPDGKATTVGKLGLMFPGVSGNGMIAGDQEVLLGGFLDKDFAYFVMGAMDKQQNRFVYIAAMKTADMPDAKFGVGKIDSPVFDPRYASPDFITGDPARVVQFIKDETRKGMVIGLPVGEMTGKTDTDKLKDYWATLNSSVKRSIGIVNRVNRLEIFVGDVPGPIGTNDGIFYDKSQITAENLKLVSFDPSKNPVFWTCTIKAPGN